MKLYCDNIASSKQIIDFNLTKENIMSQKLKAGLEWFIAKVEAMEPDHKFYMFQYEECVIGVTYANNELWDECEILRKKFGIMRKQYNNYFCSEVMQSFLPHQVDVLMLFTDAVGCSENYSITAEKWLVLAKDQLSKM